MGKLILTILSFCQKNQSFGLETHRHTRFSARQSRVAMHRISTVVLRVAAPVREMPMPLKSATYAATQIGHLGKKTRVTLGMIQPASSPPRRQRKMRQRGGGRRASGRAPQSGGAVR